MEKNGITFEYQKIVYNVASVIHNARCFLDGEQRAKAAAGLSTFVSASSGDPGLALSRSWALTVNGQLENSWGCKTASFSYAGGHLLSLGG